MFSINLGISLKSGKQPRSSNSNWIVIRNLFLGFVSNSNWIVIRNFQFLGFVPLFSWISISYFVLFWFFFFFWLSIWVIREEEGLLDKKRKAVEQTQVKKGEGFYGDCWTIGALHAQQRWLFDLLCGFSIGITWTDFFYFTRSIFSLLFLNSPQTIWRLLLNSDFRFGLSWVEPLRQVDIEDVLEAKCKREFETKAAWQALEICCLSKEIHCKSLF